MTYCITINVGVAEIVQKTDKKPASAEPASRRRSTAFCSRRLESYLGKSFVLSYAWGLCSPNRFSATGPPMWYSLLRRLHMSAYACTPA